MDLPILALDGTFIKNCYRQTLLAAIAHDGNNQMNLVVWAVVESKKESSW